MKNSSATVLRTSSFRSIQALRKSFLVLPVLGFAMAGEASAATQTWNGGTAAWNSDWTTGTSPGAGTVTAGSADTANFNGGSTAAVVNLNAAQTVTGITVQGTQTASVLLEGGGTASQTLSLGTGGITISSGAGAVTIGSSTTNQGVTVDLTGSQNWSNNSSNLFTVVNTITNVGNVTPFTLTIGGTGNTTLSGAINNGGSTGTTALTMAGSGTLTLSSTASNYTGITTLNSGVTNIAGDLSLGAAPASAVANQLTLGGGTLQFNSAGITLAVNRGITLTGGTTSIIDTQGLGSVGASPTIAGIITGSGNLTKIGSGVLQLGNGSTANTFTGNLNIQAGTVYYGNYTDATPFGTGTITLGAASGSASATLEIFKANQTYANPINVLAGSSGALTIATLNAGSSSAATFSGAVTLANNLTLSSGSTGASGLTLTGGITGTGNLITQSVSSGTTAISTGTVNMTGSITNNGSGSGTTSITSNIGSLVTNVIQNSTTSQLTLSPTGTNTFNGNLQVLAGQANVGAYSGGSNAVTLGSTTTSNNATLNGFNSGTSFTNAINVVGAGVDNGTLTITASSGFDTWSGVITLGNNLTIGNTAGGGMNVTGGIVGTGNLTLASSNAAADTVTISGPALNFTGSITNNGVTAANSISSNISSLVSSITENSATSQLSLSGTNTNTGAIVVTNGTIDFLNPGALYNSNTGSWTSSNLQVSSGGVLAVGAGANTSFSTSQISALLGTLSASSGSFGFDTTQITTGGYYNYGSAITGTLGVAKIGTGELVLSGANTYSGPTSIQNGILNVTSLNNVAISQLGSSSLGKPSSVANGTISLGLNANTGTLLYNGTGETTDRNINLAGTTGGGIIDQSGTGTLTFTSTGSVTTSGSGNKTLTLQGSGTGVFDEAIPNSTGTFTGTTSLTKTGVGTWTLAPTAADTYTGTTSITGGTLALNFANLGAASATGMINGSSSSPLTLGNGTLQILGNATTATAQTFGTVTLNGNTANNIILTPEGVNTTISTGSFTRNTGSTLNIDLSGTGGGAGTLAFNSTQTAGTLGYATVTTGGGVYGFASASGSAITMLSPNPATNSLNTANASNSAGTDYVTSGNVVMGSNTAFSVNTLTLNASGGTGSLDLGGSTLTLTQKGLLYYGSNAYTLSDGQLGTNSEVIVNDMGSGGLTIAGNNVITGTSSLTVNGTGTSTLTLSGTNNYSGNTIVNGGTLLLTGTLTGAVGINPGLVVNGNGILTVASTGSLADSNTEMNLYNNGIVNINSTSANNIGYGTTLNNNSTLNVVGGNFGTNALTVNGGTINVQTGTLTLSGSLNSGSTTGAPATINVSNGGVFNTSGDWNLGTTADGNVTVNLGLGTGSGTIFNGTRLFFGRPGGGTIVINQTAGTLLEGAYMALGDTDAGGVTYNMNGGTFESTATGASFFNSVDSGAVWNINGGTLISNAASNGISLANSDATLPAAQINILGGGVTIDLGAGATYTISVPLSHGAAGPATDGGLTLNSGSGYTGTLVLSSANTYNGGTTINAGTLDFTAAAALPSTGTVTIANGATLLISAGGTGQFTDGSGTSNAGTIGGILTGSNTSLASGATLGIVTTTGNPAVTYSSNITNSGLNISSQGSGSLTLSGNIATGTGTLSNTGTGTLVLSGTNSYTGSTTLTSGTTVFAGSTALPSTTPINLGAATLSILNNGSASNGTIAVGNNITLSGAVTATINVGNNGSNTGNTVAFGALNNGTAANAYLSTINFTGANSYLQSYASLALSGAGGQGTTLNPTSTSVTILGNVTNQMTGASGDDTLTLSGTTAGNIIDGVIADSSVYTGVGAGDTRLTKSGTGTWTLAGANTYHGPTTVSAGSLNITGAGTLGNTSSLTLGGGSMDLGGSSQTIQGALSITAAAASGNTLQNGSLAATSYSVSNATGNVAVTAALLADSTAGLTKSGAGTLTLSGANTYTGQTSANGGLLNIAGAGTLGTGANLSINGGTVDLGGTTQTVGAVTFASAPASGNALQNGNLIGTSYLANNNTASNNSIVTASLQGPGALTKNGNGTLTLSSSNSYSGGTTVTGGLLALGSTSALGTGPLTFTGGNLATTTGSAMTLANTPPVFIGGSFGLGATADTGGNGSINFGGGAVSQTATGTITLNSTAGGDTFAFGALTNTATAGVTTSAADAGAGVNTLTFTSYALGSNNTIGIVDALAGSGNITISGAVTNGSAYANGLQDSQSTGTLTLSGNNTYTGLTSLTNGGYLVLTGNNSAATGGLTLTQGTLFLNSSGALGSGTTTLGGGSFATIENTSGTAITTPLSNPNFIINTTGTISFGTASGAGSTSAGNINFGTGTVTDSGAGFTAAMLGTGQTYTFGGVFSNTHNNNQTLTANGVGDTLVLGGYNLSSSANTNAQTDTINGSGNVNITGPVANGNALNNGLAFTGTGTLTLGGANTYTGATSVNNGGTLYFSSINNLGTNGLTPLASSSLGAPTTVANGTIQLGATTTTGTLVYTGAGETTDRSLNLAGTTAGATIDDEGTGTGTLKILGNVTATGAGTKSLTLTGNTTNSGEIDGTIVDNGSTAIVKNGTGTWTLGGANTYSGGTTINAGVLKFNTAGGLGSTGGTGTVAINNGAILDLASSGATGPVTIAHAVTIGSGGGVLQVDGAGQSLTESGSITNGGNLLTVQGAGNTTIGGVIAGTGGLTKAGTGTLALTGTNTYSGTTSVNGGVVQLSTANNPSGSLGTGTALAFNNGTLEATTTGSTTAQNTLAQNITLNGAGSIQVDTGTLTLSGSVTNGANLLTVLGAGNTVMSGVIGAGSTPTGGLTKAGTGSLTITTTESYTGATTITGGTLVDSGAINSASNLVFGGGAFTYTGTGTQTFASTTVNAGVSSIANTTTGTIALTGITRNANGSLNFTSTGTYTTSTAINPAGLLGTWATFGSGTTLAYANVSSGGVISALSQTAGFFSAVTDTTGSLNYSITSGTTAQNTSAGTSANTVTNNASSTNSDTIGGAGTLALNGLLNAGGGLWTIGSGTLTAGANKELVISSNTQGITINSVIANSSAGSSALTYGGGGTLTLSGTNTYSGVTTVNSGTLNFNNSSALGNASATNTIALGAGTVFESVTNNVTLAANQAITLNGAASIGAAANTLNLNDAINNGGYLLTIGNYGGTVTLNGIVSGAGGLTDNSAGSVNLNGNNTYTGLTTLTAGSLNISGNNTSVTGGLTQNGGTLNLGSVNALGSGTVTLNSGTVHNTTNAAVTLGNNAPYVLTTGTTTLGNTTDAAGAGNINFGTGAVDIASSKTMVLQSTTAGGATFTFGGAAAETETGTSTYTFTVNDGGTYAALDTLAFTGPFTLSQDLSGTATFNGNAGISLLGGAINGGFGATSLAYSGTGSFTLGGSSYFTGTVAASSTGTFNLTGALNNIGAITVTGGGAFIESGTGVIGGTGTNALTETNSSATLSGTNTYTGFTQMNGGSLTLDFTAASAPTNNIIAGANTIDLNTGTFTAKGGGSGATNSQTFTATTLVPDSSSSIVANSGASGTVNLALGTFTRQVGSTVDVTAPASGAITTGGAAASTGVIGFASANGGATWATYSNGAFGALASGSYSTGTSNYLTGNNVNVVNGDTLAAPVTVNSLRFNPATTTGTLTFASSGTNTINTGILETSAETGATLIQGGTLTSGALNNELTFLNYGTGTTTISSNIADNANGPVNFTIGGTGTTVLTGAQNQTGITTLAGGTLNLNNSTTFSLAALAGGINSSVVLGTGTLTITSGEANAVYSGAFLGSTASTTSNTGSIIKTGSGEQVLLGNAASTFGGGVTVANGWLDQTTPSSTAYIGTTGNTVYLGSANTNLTGGIVTTTSTTLQGVSTGNNIVINGAGQASSVVSAEGEAGAPSLTLVANSFIQSGTGTTITLVSNPTFTITNYGFDQYGRVLTGGQYADKGGIVGTGNVLMNSPTGTNGAMEFYATNLNFNGSFTDISLGLTAGGIPVTPGAGSLLVSSGFGANVTSLVQASDGGGTFQYNPTSPQGFVGSIIVNAGIFEADLTNSTTGVFNTGATLTLGGGTFQLLGTSTKSQILGGTGATAVTLNPGSSTVDVKNTGTTTTLDLRGSLATGTITRNTGGTVNFTASSGTIGTVSTPASTSIIDTAQLNEADGSGILGGWATVSGSTWAANSTNTTGGIVVGLNSYTTAAAAGGYATNANVDVTTSLTQTAAITPNTLRFNTAAADTLNLSNTGTNILTDGGILVTNNVGAHTSTITGGTLEGASGKDLIVNQFNTSGALAIGSTIADNTSATALTKSGTGTLNLTNTANTYSGTTYLNAGVLNVASLAAQNTASSLGTGANGYLELNGGTLQYTGTSAATLSQAYTMTTAGGGFDASGTGNGVLTVSSSMSILGASATQGGAQILSLTGSGTGTYSGSILNGTGGFDYTTLVKTGTGTWNLTSANSYSGFTTVTAGTLVAGNINALGNYGSSGTNYTSVNNPALIVMNGGTLDLATNTSINPYNVEIASASTIESDVATAGNGITQQLGTLAWAAGGVLTINAGPNVTGGTPVVAFGAATLSGGSQITANTANVTVASIATTAGLNTTLNINLATGSTAQAGVNTVTGSISNGGFGGILSLTRSGTAGVWILQGVDTYTGSTTISAGALAIANNSAFGTGLGSSTSIVTVASGAALQLENNITTTSAVPLSIAGAGDTGAANGAIENVSGNNTYTGAITLTGTASLGSDAGNLTLTNTISGPTADTITKVGSGTVTFASTNNTYTGLTTISAGDLNLGSASALNASGAGVTFTGGTLQYSVASAAVGAADYSTLFVGGTTAISIDTNGNNVALNGTISASNVNGLTKVGSGTLTLGGTNAYTGTNSVVNGNLAFSAAANLGNLLNTITFNGGTLELTTGSTTSIGSSTLTVATLNAGSAGTGTVQVDSGANLTVAGIIVDGSTSGSLTKTGIGTLTFTAANTYTGATTISAGIINYQNSIAFGLNSAITVASGATAQVQGGQDDGGGGKVITISGTGAAGATGALENVSGYNVSEDGINLAMNATISSDSTVNVSSNYFDIVGGVNNEGYTLTVTGFGNTEVDVDPIYGTGGLIKSGTGTLTLTTADTYNGATTINAGVVSLQSAGAIGGGSAITVNTGGTLSVAFAGGIGSTSTLSVNGGTAAFANHNDTVAGVQLLGGSITGTTGILTSTSVFDMEAGTDSAILGGSVGLNKTTSGTVTLSGANTFTGAVAVKNGTLNYTAGTALGTNTALTLGVASTSSGTLEYTGTGTATLSKNITALGNGSDTIQNGGTGKLTLTGTLTKANTTLTLNGGANGIKVMGAITGGTTGNFNSDLDVVNGTTQLAAANSYTGPTYIYNAGTLQDGIANAIPIGSVVTLGNSGDGAVTNTLDLDGFAQTIASLNSVSAGGNSNSVTNSSGTAATLTLSGVNSDSSAVSSNFGGVIKNGTGTVALTISGGTHTLSGANIYTGATTINGGDLIITGSTATGSAVALNAGILTASGTVGGTVAVANGGTLTGTGSTGAVTVSGGGIIGLQNGSIGTLTVAGLSTGNSTTPSSFTFDIGSSVGSSDTIADTGFLTLNGVGGTTITIGDASGVTSLAPGLYNLITYTGTYTGSLSNLTLSTTTLNGKSLSLVQGSGVIELNVGSAALASAYFNGAGNDLNTAANYDPSASAGASNGGLVNAGTNVFFSANRNTSTAPNISTAIEVNSVNFGAGSGTSSGITVSSNNTSDTLQVDATNANGNTAGSGITVTGGGTDAISAPVVLGGSQSWTTDSGSHLTVSGQVSGGYALTKAGTGAVVLSSSTGNIYTGGTTVNAGTLYVNNTSNSGTGTGAVTVNSGGTLAGEGIISTSAGVAINGGGKLASGDPSQISGSSLTSKGGLSLVGTALTVGSGSGTANLTFDLAAGTSGINGGTATSGYDFSNPNNNTTYLSLNNSSSINFAGATSISLIDLTNTTGSNGTLALTLASPYLLIHAASNTNYLNLVINSGTVSNPVYSLSQNDGSVNGYVLGVATGMGTLGMADSYTPISISEFEADGMTPLQPQAGGNYNGPALYLDAGNLEVVPEPGTWALMIGGLALLVYIQRRRNKIG